MNPLEGLAQYLDRLERRLRLFTWTRGAAAVLAAALVLTVLIVGALMLFTFAPSGLIAGRFVLFLGIGAAIAAALIVPLLRMNRRKAAQEVEHSHPGFDQRLLTFTERSQTNANDPFLPLLAEDALVVARGAEPERVVPQKRLLQFGSIAAAAAGVLVWLMFWGPGVFGYGTALLWGSYPKDQNSKSYYNIAVQPGSKTIRRKTDVIVSAKLSGFLANKASIFVQYASGNKWEEAPMQPEPSGPGFAFLLPSVPEDLQYYVVAGGLKSDTFKIHTVDLPSVKNIRVTYTFPAWTGMAAITEDPGGDLRAVEGTMAKVEVTTDKPLANGQLAVEDGKPIDLTSEGGNRLTAMVPIEKDGSYHVATLDHAESVRLSDDYFIEARKVGAPTVQFTKPGRDQKVSPIEEVAVALSAEDEYPLQEFDLHYSVNGGAEKTLSMLKQKGEKHVEGSTMLSMEEFKAVPGDIVSIYATAKDGKNTTKTDMFFIEAVPFEFEYSQSQESGGGGGGGMDQQDQQISEREKEIIAATFNQLKADPHSKVSAAENGKYLSEVQAKLRDQAQSLSNRTKARQLDGSGAAFSQFVKEMELAVAVMSPASDKLKGLQFQDALQPEQQALQHLLRAESTFRQIQVQVSRGGGGGGGGGAGRDLANLFDLELDKDKNQYETNASSAAEQKQQQIDDALKKLEELARRQQELAQQQQNAQQLAQQRWEQEMLRREAEELKRQMEQLQRGDQSQQNQQSASNSQSSSSSSQSGQGGQGSQSSSNPQNGQQSQSNPQSARNQQQQQQNGQQPQQQPRQQAGLQGRQQQASNEQLQRAIQQLEQATRDMGQSASARNGQGGQSGQAQNDAQSAAERLKQAGQTLESLRHQQNGSELSQMADEADRLANQQHSFEDKLKQSFGRGQGSQQTADQLVKDKQKQLDEYNQLQKEMQQTARDLNSTQPQIARQLRDTMGRTQQAEIGTRMEVTQNALEQGMGQYAILREAPVTRALDQLRDELQALREDASGSQSASANGSKEDKSEQAMRQALNDTDRVRRELEQLGRAAAGQRGGQQGNQQGRQGNQPGNQQQGGQQGQQGNQPGQQASNSGQQGGQQGQSGQQGQQGQGGQQGQQGGQGQQGSQGQQGGGQQGGQQSAQGSAGPNGGGYGVNSGPRGGAWDGRGSWGGQWWDGTNTGAAWDGNSQQDKQQNPEQAYSDLMRDLNRLRGAVSDDKDLTREYLDLAQRAQQLDPKHWNNQGQLDSVIGSQVMGSVDQMELLLRRKLTGSDGSVRSANPRNTPPGYADAVAEYYKRLSKQ